MDNFAKVFSRVYSFIIDSECPFQCNLDNGSFDIEFEMDSVSIEDFFDMVNDVKKELPDYDFELSVCLHSSRIVHVSKDGEVHDVVMYECNIIGRDSSDLPF